MVGVETTGVPDELGVPMGVAKAVLPDFAMGDPAGEEEVDMSGLWPFKSIF